MRGSPFHSVELLLGNMVLNQGTLLSLYTGLTVGRAQGGIYFQISLKIQKVMKRNASKLLQVLLEHSHACSFSCYHG